MIYNKISVITPSFNQGRYIEQTILSVIGQHYPNLEYIIIDGGSTDNTVDIIKKYEKHIAYWISEKDYGQSNAINKGFDRATGDILCWLNSDDYYLPGTLLKVNNALKPGHSMLFYGNAIHLNESKNIVYGSVFDPFKKWDIKYGDFIVQPSSFWTRKTFEATGKLNESLHFGFDWEWYARAKESEVEFIPSSDYYSVYRLHDTQKSNDANTDRFRELIGIEQKLNPEKFAFLVQYIKTYNRNLRWLLKLSDNKLTECFQYRLLKLMHPKLIARIDRVTLKKYIKYFHPGQKQ